MAIYYVNGRGGGKRVASQCVCSGSNYRTIGQRYPKLMKQEMSISVAVTNRMIGREVVGGEGILVDDM